MEKILVLNPDWCKGCGICAAFCPKESLEMIQGKVSLKENNQCILCGLCEQRCPDYAIFIVSIQDEAHRPVTCCHEAGTVDRHL